MSLYPSESPVSLIPHPRKGSYGGGCLYDTLDVPPHPSHIKEPHHAWHNHTGHPPTRARADASSPSPRPLWLSLGLAHFTAVCRGAEADRDCGFPVVLALQCLPYRSPLSCRTTRLHRGCQRSPGGSCAHHNSVPLDQTLDERLTQDPPPGPMAGAAPAGVAPHWRANPKPS